MAVGSATSNQQPAGKKIRYVLNAAIAAGLFATCHFLFTPVFGQVVSYLFAGVFAILLAADAVRFYRAKRVRQIANAPEGLDGPGLLEDESGRGTGMMDE